MLPVAGAKNEVELCEETPENLKLRRALDLLENIKKGVK